MDMTTDKYDWTIHTWLWCDLMSSYFDQLSLLQNIFHEGQEWLCEECIDYEVEGVRLSSSRNLEWGCGIKVCLT